MRSTNTSRSSILLLAAAMAAALTLLPSSAQAQEADNVSARGKGIAGGALLGAEVVMIPIAIAGVDSWWPYVVFGAVGAGGGAVGGYFVEQVAEGGDGTGPAEPSLYMLAGGMALVIPTIVAVLNATAYDPEDDETDEEVDESDEGETPGVDADGSVDVETGARGALPMALIGVDATERKTRLSMGIPAVSVGPAYDAKEVATYGVEPGTQVHIPVVQGTF